MSKEFPKNIEQNKEAIFQSWLVEFKGELWLNKKVMPEGVYAAIQMYEHYLCHGHDGNSPDVIKRKEDFKKLTGYDIEDFMRYQKEQEQKLKNNSVN